MSLLLQRKTASAKKAFLQLLGSCQPQITAHSSWAKVRPFIKSDDRYSTDCLNDAQREALFEEYVAELQTQETLRLRRGEEAFRVSPLERAISNI